MKKIYLHYLIFGISLLILSCNSNENVDCLVNVSFIFENQTEFNISTPIGNILSGEELSVEEQTVGPCGNLDRSNFVPPFIGNTEVIFDDVKCVTYIADGVASGQGIVDIENYTFVELSDAKYELRYLFTVSDYLNAIDCD